MSNDSNDDQSQNQPVPSSVSGLAEDIRRLQQASVRALDKRNRLPQPLFWSLFHSQIHAIKRRKKRERMVRSMLNNF